MSGKFNINKTINAILFVLIYAFRSITDAVYVSKGIEGNFLINIKYFLIAIAIILCILQLKKGKKIFSKEAKCIIITVVVLFVISMFAVLLNGKFYSSILENCFKLLLPVVYVYLFINVMDFKNIYRCMCFALMFTIVGYILEIGLNNFSIENIQLIDFTTSYSPFESSFAAGASIAFCAFFCYYRHNKFFTILSFVFACFTFKRLSVIFAFLLLIFPYITNPEKKIGKNTKNITIVLFIIATLVYMQLLLPENSNLFKKVIGESQAAFTMGRSNFFHYLIFNNYSWSGLGTTTDFIGHGIEMDLIRIYLETTIIGLVVFVAGYWNCSGNNRYTYFLMLFQFLNLLTSHSLSNSFNWILTLLTIASITYLNKNSLELKRSKT